MQDYRHDRVECQHEYLVLSCTHTTRSLTVFWLVVVVLSATFVLPGCEILGRDASVDADADLYGRLLAVSSTGSVSDFLLPDPGDWSSLPQDPRNPITRAKVDLGQLLFHDSALGTDPRRPESQGTWSCATCHQARAGFQAGVRQGIGEGGVGFGSHGEGRIFEPTYFDLELDVQPIRSPSILNVAYQEVMLWNGQFGASGVNESTRARWTPGSPKEINFLGFEGVETQSIAGLSVHRMGSLGHSIVSTDPVYKALWAAAFPGSTPNAIEAGLAIAAYERTVVANRAPWQRWLRGENGALSYRQKQGALLFFGKAACYECHSGPALNSMTFHALGMAELSGPDVRFDPRDLPKPKGRGAFTLQPEDDYCFKTPQLYNLADAVFLGHGASFSSVRAVIEYKNRAIPESQAAAGHLSPLFRPLELDDAEIDALTDFIEYGLRDPDLLRYEPKMVPSGSCIPVNDLRAREDLGCGSPLPAMASAHRRSP